MKNKYPEYEKLQKEQITFKVNGENKVNEIINYTAPLLVKIFEEFGTESILKQDESLFKKIKDKTDVIIKESEDKFTNKDIDVSAYLDCSKYHIVFNIRLRFKRLDKNGFLYYEGNKYIIDMDMSKLTIKRFFEVSYLEKIDLKEQLKMVDKCLKLHEELEEEKAKLKPYNLKEFIK